MIVPPLTPPPQSPGGVCGTCRGVRTVTPRRGSVFYRCARADVDPRFVRYPPLPVLACPGYEFSDPLGHPPPTGDPERDGHEG